MHFVRIVETLNEPLLTLMKKYLLWICTAAALLAAGASCSDDPEVDSVGRVGIQQESLTADGGFMIFLSFFVQNYSPFYC